MDFDAARNMAFDALAETASVRYLNDTERKAAGLQKHSSVCRILTEVFTTDNTISPITLLMALPNEFPFVLPKIYLSKEDRKWVGYIPHVDVAGYICVYDEESIIIDVDRPGEVAKDSFRKSLQIIEQGIRGENRNEFSDEFISYWTEKYDEKDEIFSGLTMLEQIPGNPPCRIRFLIIENAYSGYHLILHDDGKFFKRLKNFLVDGGYSIIEKEGLYLGSTENLFPPFNLTNADAFKIVKDRFPHSLKEFERYINQTAEYRLLTFSISIGINPLLLGWYVPNLSTNRNGFRKGNLTPLNVLNTFQKNDHVIRLRFETYTKERLSKRTDGMASSIQYKITFAGLGSIGSSLIPHITSLGIDSLNLIDPDILTLANINRHLLGPDDIGKPKVEGIRNYLLKGNPLMDVSSFTESIIQFIRNKQDILNQSDFLFIVVGKNVVENYILQALRENIITTPTFFIWIEPYLVGGHCLYVQPGHLLSYNDFYRDHLFNYNVIDAVQYKNANNKILLREAGCQGSYMPYGQKNITLFLNSLVPYLFQIIEGKDKRNLSLTWRGKMPDEISLDLSAYGNQLTEGNIQLNEL